MPSFALSGKVIVLAAVLSFATACSSSGGSAPPAGTGTPPEQVASQDSTADASAGVAAARAAVKAATTFPTTIPVTDPLPSAPPSGKTVVFLQCDVPTCAFQGDGVKAAAKAIGWNVKVLNFKLADPATAVTAMKTALQYKPVAVSFAGVSQDIWRSLQPDYVKAGAVLVPSSVDPEPSGDGVVPGHGFGADEQALGKLLADQAVADSNGKAKMLFVNVPSSTVYGPVADTFRKEVGTLCPDCSISELDLTFPQIAAGGLNGAVVSELKRHSGTDYVVSVNGTFVGGLPPALQTAGLKNIKIISGKGDSRDQQNVLDGTALATVNSPFVLGGWQDVDIAIRHVMNLPIPEGDHSAAPVLLTKDNIGSPKDSYDVPSDYAAQFAKLWQVG